jgi:hypothetical protein
MQSVGGIPMVKAQKLQINLGLTRSQSRELTRVANRETVTRTDIIHRAIDEFLEREKAN